MATFVTTLILLIVHIISGFLALITGFLSMINRKGGNRHRLTGKLFFAGMTGVFVTSTAISLIKNNPFLLMVGFFSYYLACSGYRALYLKKLHLKQKPRWIDWLISGSGVVFGIGLMVFSIDWFITRGAWGTVPLLFGGFCLLNAVTDIRRFFVAPTDKQHWLVTHGSRMGGSFAATVTAFIVVNFSIGNFTWVLWVLPGVLIGIWIGRVIRPYKAKGASRAEPSLVAPE